MRREARRFLFTVLGGTLGLFLLYFAGYRYQIGAAVEAEWWIRHIEMVKERRAGEVPSPRILILSGSNAMFGIDAGQLEGATGLPVVDLSVHAVLDIDYLYLRLVDQLRAGDLLLMPLEPDYYWRDRYSEGFVNNMLAWGEDPFIDRLTPIDRFRLFLDTPKQRVFGGIVRQEGTNPLLPRGQVLSEYDAMLSGAGPAWRGYSHLSLDRYGEIDVDAPPKEILLLLRLQGTEYFPSGMAISGHFLAGWRRIEALVAERGAKLLVTWPVTLRNHRFDLTLPEHQQRMDAIRARLLAAGVEVRCNPALFNLGVDLFFNTEYHLNHQGRRIRTRHLAECIEAVQAGGDGWVDWPQAVGEVVAAERAVMAESTALWSPYFLQRIRDLKGLSMAVEAYQHDHGSFPLSRGWDGPQSRWGRTGEEWISGLVPEYLAELPQEPSGRADGSHQYLYRSDGTDYKLLVHFTEEDPADCPQVALRYPNLIDPQRNCWAYGIWTPGAAGW